MNLSIIDTKSANRLDFESFKIHFSQSLVFQTGFGLFCDSPGLFPFNPTPFFLLAAQRRRSNVSRVLALLTANAPLRRMGQPPSVFSLSYV